MPLHYTLLRWGIASPLYIAEMRYCHARYDTPRIACMASIRALLWESLAVLGPRRGASKAMGAWVDALEAMGAWVDALWVDALCAATLGCIICIKDLL